MWEISISSRMRSAQREWRLTRKIRQHFRWRAFAAVHYRGSRPESERRGVGLLSGSDHVDDGGM
jgi:hypothetical protein